MELRGAVALVTGSAQGIGRAISEALLANRCRVMLSDVMVDQGTQTCKQLSDRFGPSNVSFQKCDVTIQSDLEALYKATLDTFKRLDIVCNNAGVGFEQHPHGDLWRKSIDINLTAVINSTFLARQHMSVESGGRGGVVINICSMGGLMPMPSAPVYCASKHGVIGFCRSLAQWPLNSKVYVYALCPSFVQTRLFQQVEDAAPGMAEVAKEIGFVSPEQVAEGALQLVTTQPQSGSVMRVTKANGIDFEKYRKSRL